MYNFTDGEVLPAYAGMIRQHRQRLRQRQCAPRVCGDDPGGSGTGGGGGQCSPRMRG